MARPERESPADRPAANPTGPDGSQKANAVRVRRREIEVPHCAGSNGLLPGQAGAASSATPLGGDWLLPANAQLLRLCHLSHWAAQLQIGFSMSAGAMIARFSGNYTAHHRPAPASAQALRPRPGRTAPNVRPRKQKHPIAPPKNGRQLWIEEFAVTVRAGNLPLAGPGRNGGREFFHQNCVKIQCL